MTVFTLNGRLFRTTSACYLTFLFAAIFAMAQESSPEDSTSKRRLPPGFIQKTLRLEENGHEYKYAMFIPPQYAMNPEHRWPLILFLHGSGECGEDGVRQTTVGLPVYISFRPTKFPFIVLMPQAHSMWFRGQEALAVWRMLARAREEYRVDDERIYITGLSMGAYGAWELAMAQPEVFAAIVPVCGVAPKDFMVNVSNIPVWAFHGALDKNVPVSGSREAIKELRSLGGAWPKYTEYPDLGHECWDRAYATMELWPWLLSQRRKYPRVVDYRIAQGMARAWWLLIKAEDNLKSPGRIRAEIEDGGRIRIDSEGIEYWGLASDRDPLKPGTDIEVTWNGALVYRGPFKGTLTFKPKEKDNNTAPSVDGANAEKSAPDK